MKKILITGVLLSLFISAQNNDWDRDDDFENENSTFEKMKIKNRSQKEYKDKIYKYIKGDYTVKNNTVEIANIELDDTLRNQDIEINVHIENLEVIGNEYKDSINLKQNKYKNFIQHDEKSSSFEEEENFNNEEMEENALKSEIRVHDKQRKKIIDEDISELETIDLKENKDIKEVNIFIEDTQIRVDN